MFHMMLVLMAGAIVAFGLAVVMAILIAFAGFHRARLHRVGPKGARESARLAHRRAHRVPGAGCHPLRVGGGGSARIADGRMTEGACRSQCVPFRAFCRPRRSSCGLRPARPFFLYNLVLGL